MEVNPGLYRHYKGNIYEVIGTAQHSETHEKLVVYKTADQSKNDTLWVRPAAMFSESVSVDGVEQKRFEKIR